MEVSTDDFCTVSLKDTMLVREARDSRIHIHESISMTFTERPDQYIRKEKRRLSAGIRDGERLKMYTRYLG